jgi:hypothetical protein
MRSGGIAMVAFFHPFLITKYYLIPESLFVGEKIAVVV